MRELLTGNDTVALAVKLSRAQVVAAYPISPQTSIAEKLCLYCATGELKAEFIRVESETSALAACIGASLSGARAFTATSSQGLALMHELLHWASGARLSVVLVNVNRAMAAPWTLGTDLNDSLSQRDTGWLQFYCSNNQEVMDTVIQAFRITEEVLLPCMVNLEGFLISHTMEAVEIPEQEAVDSYLGARRAPFRMDTDDPHTFGGGVDPETYSRFKLRAHQDMLKAMDVILKANQLFKEQFGRSYGLVEHQLMDDAQLVLVASGTIAGTCAAVARSLREKGFPVGVLRLRCFRPFPAQEVARSLGGARAVIVLDRDISPGRGGIFCQEVQASLYAAGVKPHLEGHVVGLGGKDVTSGDIEALCSPWLC